mmetsp:Transcript_45319/g.131849  ORF Transcript_45319/g.131849 Transcript_45319/m.131849 type:complete len:232 (-) Transcript_45319:1685-2380(-)
MADAGNTQADAVLLFLQQRSHLGPQAHHERSRAGSCGELVVMHIGSDERGLAWRLERHGGAQQPGVRGRLGSIGEAAILRTRQGSDRLKESADVAQEPQRMRERQGEQHLVDVAGIECVHVCDDPHAWVLACVHCDRHALASLHGCGLVQNLHKALGAADALDRSSRCPKGDGLAAAGILEILALGFLLETILELLRALFGQEQLLLTAPPETNLPITAGGHQEGGVLRHG